MLSIFVFFLLWLLGAVALILAWLRAEWRGKPASTRIGLGFSAIACAIALAVTACCMYESGRKHFDYGHFADTLVVLQESLERGKSSEVQQLLAEMVPPDSEQNYQSISALQDRLDRLSGVSASSAPEPGLP